MEDPEIRRQQRRTCVDQFLHQIGLTRSGLAESTQKNLDDWARQELLIANQPSANRANAILLLCKAVESEVKSRLGPILGHSAVDNSMGPLAYALRSVRFTEQIKQKLHNGGVKPGFVSSTLPSHLLDLAKLRKVSYAAHGGTKVHSATQEDLLKARELALHIFRGISGTPGT